MKIITLALLLIFSIALKADEDKLKKIILDSYPDLPIKSIKKTDYNDLYEIFLGDQIIYSDKSFNFLITEGRLINPRTKIDITGDRLQELTKIDFNQLPFKKAIKVVRGNGKRKIAVFSDIDCPYCRKFEKETITEMDDITIYTFLFPLDFHPDAKFKSAKVWCASDRAKAWNNIMLHNKLAENAGDCNTPIKETISLARDLGISSTPTIILPNGIKLPGAVGAKDLEERLNLKD